MKKEFSADYRLVMLQRLYRIHMTLEYQLSLISQLQRGVIFNQYQLPDYVVGEVKRYVTLEGHIIDDLAALDLGKGIDGVIVKKEES